MYSKLGFVLGLLASSASAFNGQPPSPFVVTQKTKSSLNMSGGGTAPALKVSAIYLRYMHLYQYFFSTLHLYLRIYIPIYINM